jgi:hypothetical protein
MSKRQLLAIAVVLAVSTLVFTTISLRQEAQTADSSNDDATVVRRGQTTEKGREYSKEYRMQYPERSHQKLTDLIEAGKARGKGEIIGTSLGEPMIPTVGTASPTKPGEFLANLACEADAVVVGSVAGKVARLTDDETLIYTEYELVVNDVIKDNTRSPISRREAISVTRPGGLIKVEGQLIRFEDRSFKQLQLKKEYLLFLRYLPGASGYVLANEKGNIILENGNFKQLGRPAPELNNFDGAQMLLNTVREFATNNCPQ